MKSFFVITQENAPPVHVWSNNDYGHQRFGVSQVILLLLLKKIFESTLLSNRECRTTFSFRIERSQLRCVRHKTRMPRRLARRVLLATPSGKHPRGQPRTSLCDYISNIAWFRLDMETAELSEIPENREIFQDPLGLLSPRSYKMRVRKVSHALLWWNKTILTKQWVNSVITYSWAKLLILLKVSRSSERSSVQLRSYWAFGLRAPISACLRLGSGCQTSLSAKRFPWICYRNGLCPWSFENITTQEELKTKRRCKNEYTALLASNTSLQERINSIEYNIWNGGRGIRHIYI